MSDDNLRTERFKDRFIRWQKITTNQLSFLNYLIIIMGGGVLAFEINLIFPESQFSIEQIKIILLSSLFLSLSIILGLFTAINRLRDFRETKNLVKSKWNGDSKENIKQLELETDKLGNWTWRFFWGQLGLFILGIFILAVFIAYHIFCSS